MRTVCAVDSELAALFHEAAVQTAKGSKSFYLASRFFPPDLARAAHAVYWFCRYTDDLVDECENVAQGTRDLHEWEQALAEITKGRKPQHPVLQVFTHVVQQYQIPFELAFELIEGMRMDLHKTRYATFDELYLFCYRVASVVGLMMCSVIGFSDNSTRAQAWQYAIDLGIAMQLTNILRDVDEDLQRGRIYLPQEEMERFDYDEADLQGRLYNSAFVQLMSLQAERAQHYYNEGNAGIALLNREGRFAVQIASAMYREILSRIESNRYQVFGHRIVVGNSKKYRIIAANLAGPYLRRFLRKIGVSTF